MTRRPEPQRTWPLIRCKGYPSRTSNSLSYRGLAFLVSPLPLRVEFRFPPPILWAFSTCKRSRDATRLNLVINTTTSEAWRITSLAAVTTLGRSQPVNLRIDPQRDQP